MICRNCQSKSNRIQIIDGNDYCGNCSLMTETGGTTVDGSITRNSFRIREQQRAFAEDIQPPYVYDKSRRKAVPSKDFIKSFPEQAEKTFTSKELKDVGITKIKGK